MEEETVAVDPAVQDPQDNSQIDIYNNYSYSCLLCSSPISKEKASLLTLVNLVGEVKANILISTLCKSLHLPNQPWAEILRLDTTPENCNNPLPFYYCVKCIELMKDMERLWAKLDKLKYQVEELLAKSFAAQNDGRILENLNKKVHDDEKSCEKIDVVGYFWNLFHVRKSLLQELKVDVGWQLIGENYDHHQDRINLSDNAYTNSKNTVQSQNDPLQISAEYESNAVHHPLIQTDLESIKYELEEEINFIESSVPDLMSNNQEDEVSQEMANYIVPNREEIEDDQVWNPPSDTASESDDEDFTLSQEGSKSTRSKLQLKTRGVGSLTLSMRSRLMEEIYSGSKLLQIKLKPIQWEPLENRWIFSDPPSSNNHFTSIHKERTEYKFKCKICDRRFQGRRKFEIHRNTTVHKIKKQALIHESSSSNSVKVEIETDDEYDESLLPPMKRPTRRRKLISECTDVFICTRPGCNMRFDTKLRRDAHVLRKHENDLYPFKCKFCGKGHNSNQKMIKHERSHTGESPFVCKYCGKSFRCEDSLHSHFSSTHKERKTNTSTLLHENLDEEFSESLASVVRYPCSHRGCLMVFDTELQKSYHFARSHKNGIDEYKFKCNICDRRFPGRQKFDTHRNTAVHKIKKQKLIEEMSNSNSAEEKVETDDEYDETLQPPMKTLKTKGMIISESSFSSSSHKAGNGEYKFKCNICDRHFPARYKFELHRNGTVHKSKKQKLIQEMSNSSSAEQNVETDEELDEAQLPPIKRRKRRQIALSKCTELFFCTHDGCSWRFDTEVRRDAHVLKAHNNDCYPFRCKICGKGHKAPERLEVHERLHTGESPFVCETCGNAFRSEVYLKEHLKQHELRNTFLNTTTASRTTTKSTNSNFRNSTTTCPICNKSMRWDSLRQHIIIHDEEKTFLCEICSSSFLRKVSLNNHQRKAHPEIYVLPFKKEHTCKICSKLFHNKFYLKRHEMLHTGQNVPFQCSLCPYKCFGKTRMELHERRHKNERLYKCSHPGCTANFFTNSLLIAHNRVHTGERPFQCNLCEMSFKTKEMRKRHTDVIHKKLTHYKCELCGEGFPMNKYLKRHLERHQSGKIPIPDKLNDTTSTTIVTHK